MFRSKGNYAVYLAEYDIASVPEPLVLPAEVHFDEVEDTDIAPMRQVLVGHGGVFDEDGWDALGMAQVAAHMVNGEPEPCTEPTCNVCRPR